MKRKYSRDLDWLQHGIGHAVTARVPVRQEFETMDGCGYKCPVCSAPVGMKCKELDHDCSVQSVGESEDGYVIYIFDAWACKSCGCELNWDDAN